MDRTCLQWTGIAALLCALAACVAYPPQQRLPPREAPSISPAAVVPDSMLALSKAVPEAGASLVAAAASGAASPAAAASAPPADTRQDAEAERARALQQALQAWQQAWQGGDFDGYVRAYDARFKGSSRTRQAWEKDRKKRLARGRITVRISEVQWKQVSDDVVEARFLQHFEQGRYRDTGYKTLRLQRTDAGWRITQENWRAARRTRPG